MNYKYEFTDETIVVGSRVLHRIKAIRDFGNIEKGDLGGFIQSEDNLSQTDNAWVSGNARVYGDALVSGDAKISGNARVYGDALVFGNAEVSGNAKISGNALVFGNARISGDAEVCGDAKVFGNAEVCGDAEVSGDAKVSGNARVSNDAIITNTSDHLVIGPIGSRNDYTTFFKCKDNIIRVICGCFSGTIEKFREKVKETHGDNKYAKQYEAAINFAKMYFGGK